MTEHAPSSDGANLGFTLGIVSVAALGGFLFGFDTAVINGAVPVLNGMFMDADSGFAGGLELTEASRNLWVGQSVALALVGAAIGAFAAGPITNKIGRKMSMVIAAVMFLASAIGSGLPVTIFDFTFWRLLGGMAFGAASVIAPAYIAEVSPAKFRGRLGSMQQLAIVIGIFVALMSNLLIAENAGGAAEAWLGGFAAWKWMFWIEAIPALIYLICATQIPESPRYLVIKDRDGDARRVLDKVLGTGAGATKIREIRESLSSEHKPRLSDILGPALFKKIVWLGIGLSVFQQFVGINVVFYYSNLLWQAVGLDESKAFLNTAIGGGTNVLTTFIAIALVDKIGRKPLLIFGSVLMMISLGAMSLIFSTAPLVTKTIDVELPSTMTEAFVLNIEADTEGVTGSGMLTVDPATVEVDEDAETIKVPIDVSEIVPDSTEAADLVIRGLPEGGRIALVSPDADGVVAVSSKTQPNLSGENKHLGTLALIALNLFIVGFGASWGPIVWVMLGEMFSNQIRGAGLAVAASAQWGANYLISATFPVMLGVSLGFAYGFYAVSALLSLIFVMVLIPETKGKELETMGELEG